MKKTLFYLLFTFAFAINAQAQWPLNVTVIKDEPHKKVKVNGDLKEGSILGDLSWASNSSVACFPASQNVKFRGNHVLYATLLPARSSIRITLRPASDSANINLYAYLISSNNTTSVVPNLNSCLTCKSSYSSDKPKKGAAAATPTNVRVVEFKSLNDAYNIVIGVAGGETLTSGAYILEVELK